MSINNQIKIHIQENSYIKNTILIIRNSKKYKEYSIEQYTRHQVDLAI